MYGSVNTPGRPLFDLTGRVKTLEASAVDTYSREESVQLLRNNTETLALQDDGRLVLSVPDNAIYTISEDGKSIVMKSDEEIASLTGLNGGQVAGMATGGADYAEMFEWSDGNPRGEDRTGLLVALDTEGKVKVAREGDRIIGIVSGNPALIGNEDTEWRGKYIRDRFGRTVVEFLEQVEEEVVAPNGLTGDALAVWMRVNHVHYSPSGQLMSVRYILSEEPTKTFRYKVNPDWNQDQPYVARRERPEWACVGILGVIPLQDDGSCIEGEFCRARSCGRATLCEEGYAGQKYLVLGRIDESTVKVLFK